MPWEAKSSRTFKAVAAKSSHDRLICCLQVVHFDLKSANILLSRDLTAKIADVGLAKILKNQYLSTLSGGVGTFAYAAPEVLCLTTYLQHLFSSFVSKNALASS